MSLSCNKGLPVILFFILQYTQRRKELLTFEPMQSNNSIEGFVITIEGIYEDRTIHAIDSTIYHILALRIQFFHGANQN